MQQGGGPSAQRRVAAQSTLASPSHVPSLVQFTTAALIKWKALLGDVGHTPVELLAGVLAACSPQELADVEDGTREGIAARDLSHWTWPLWWRHASAGQLATLGALPARPPPLPASTAPAEPPPPPPQPGVAPANFRLVYEQRMEALAAKQAASGKRLRGRWDEEAEKKKSRCIQVIATLPRRDKGPRAAAPAPAKPVAADSRHRLLTKLGLPAHQQQHSKPLQLAIRPARAAPLPPRSALTARAAAKPAAPAKQQRPPTATTLLEEVDLFKRRR